MGKIHDLDPPNIYNKLIAMYGYFEDQVVLYKFNI